MTRARINGQELGTEGLGGAGDLTELLRAWAVGSDQAGDQLAARLYPRLRRQAAAMLLKGWADVSLQPTELVHEAFMRLAGQRKLAWQNRDHFLAMVSCFMRRALLNHARDRRAQKRGAGALPGRTDDAAAVVVAAHIDLLALDIELRRLAGVDPLAARVIELRYFGGLSVDDTARILDVGRATVVRKWRAAKVWLHAALAEGRAVEP